MNWGFSRSISSVALCCAGVLVLLPNAAAQVTAYPTKPVRFLVGFNPGGGTDITARVVGDALSQRLGQPIIVDNRPAAGGVLARKIAAESTPDGYTLLMLSGSQVIGAALVHNEPVDMRNTYAAICRLTSQPYLLLTNPSFPAKNVRN